MATAPAKKTTRTTTKAIAKTSAGARAAPPAPAGAPVTTLSPVEPDRSPPLNTAAMDTNVKVIGALQIILGLLFLVTSTAILFGGDYGAKQIEEEGQEEDLADMVRAVVTVLSFLFLAVAILAIVGAIGLFMLAPWGRILSLIVAAASLLAIPFGTAFGIYSLIIMTRPATAALFERKAAA